MSESDPDRIKFADELVPDVLNEEKNATVRFDGFEDARVGDTLSATTEAGAPFAEINVRRTATALAVEAHHLLEVFGASYPSDTPEEIVESLNQHYDTTVRPGSNVRILVFEVVRHA